MSTVAQVAPFAATETTPRVMPCYQGKKGPVQATITRHAYDRFRERWARIFPGKALPADVNAEIARQFNRASRVTNLGVYEKRRMDRHGKDTLYFRADCFTFIVQDAAIVTVEISDRDMRHLNKKPLRWAA